MKLIDTLSVTTLCLIGSSSLTTAWVTPKRRSRHSSPAISVPVLQQQKARGRRHSTSWLCLQLASNDENVTAKSEEGSKKDYTGKTLYQRIFYRFSPGSDVDVHDSLVMEERVRFQADPENSGYLVPVGHRTLILRDGAVEDGEIGEDLFTLTIDHAAAAAAAAAEGGSSTKSTHTGAGTDKILESEIATALYLASNPSLCSKTMLQVACGSGVASLLGAIGAGFVSRRLHGEKASLKHDVAEDVLTIASEKDHLFPADLELLTLTDSDESSLNVAFHNCKHSGVSPAKVSVEPLDMTPRPNRMSSLSAEQGGIVSYKEYKTIVASDVAFTYPEAKELARLVANRLEPSKFYLLSTSKDTTLPRFIHVCPDSREDVVYLHRLLEHGYKMSVSTGYLKLEKLMFHVQTLPTSEPESALDDVELEVQQFKEIHYQALVAQHHPEYAGQGSGELFFPMATGEYEMKSGSTYMEPDSGGMSPW